MDTIIEKDEDVRVRQGGSEMANVTKGRNLDSVIEQYVDSRKDSLWPISTSVALRAIRTVLPRCALSDRQLADLIAASAIRKGRNISFDM